MSKKTSGYVRTGLAIFGGLYLTILATLWLASPRNAISGCNPPDEPVTCVSTVTVECINNGYISGDVTPGDPICLNESGTGTVSFVCVAEHSGYLQKKTTRWYLISGCVGVCPPDTIEYITGVCPVECEWTITGPEFSTNGVGCTAEASVTNCGLYTASFTVSPAPDCPCPPSPITLTATQAVSGVKIDIPDLIGVNDYVHNCFDPAGYPYFFVTNSVEFYTDDDLKDISWSVCPADDADDGEVTITSVSDKLRVLAIDYNGDFMIGPIVFPLNEPPSSIKIEGMKFSQTVGDAPVLITYNGCTATDTTTVVRVLLDKFNYNRADPFPEVEIISLAGFEPGNNASITYKILGDVLEPEQVLTDTYQVTDQIGTWEYKTPDFANRIGNIGWDTVRYTVFDNGAALGIRWEHADPSHARMATMPDPAMMHIDIKDATAETPEDAYNHLSRLPEILGDHYITGATPAFEIPQIKVFAETPPPAYTNEVSPAVGNETVLMTLLGVSQDSAVVLEIEGPRTVGVNERFEAPGDPGDNAIDNQDPADEDFIQLDLDGVPGCIVKGTVTWSVLYGDIRLISSDASQIGTTVTTNFTTDFPSDFLYVKVEGLAASDAIDDCLVQVEIELEDGDASGNPPAFQGQTLSAEYKLTVTDLRWTGWKADDASGKTPERTDMLACDLELRPAVRIDYPDTGNTVSSNNIVTVSGVARSMIDIIRDIRVNGEIVPQTNIFFLGQTVDGMTATSVRELTDRPPPYEVTFEYDLELDETLSIRIEARNGIGPWPGTAGRRLMLEAAAPSIVTNIEDMVSDPTYDLPSMTNFFDQGWAFLYKTEVDHRGAGKAVVDCYEKAGVQPDGGLFRLRQPAIFIDKYGYNNAIPGPGLFIDYEQEVAPISYDNGATIGMRKLFPIELTVSDSAGIVSNAIEWTHGALLITNSSAGTLTISLPDPDNDLPSDTTITLSVAGIAGQPNPYSGFANQTFSPSSLPATVSLPPSSTVGAAAFVLEMYSPTYGDLGKDRVKVYIIAPPELIAVTDFFTPRQIETPPYHGAKVDYKRWDVPSGAPCTIVFTAEDAGGATVFARPVDPDEAAVAYVPNFQMDELYKLDGTNDPYGFSFTVERLAWDGRYDADTNGLIDVEGGHTRWADQPATTVAADVPYNVQFEIRNISGALIYTSSSLITKTTPLELDGDSKPLMGPAPYFGFFRDQINSKYSNVSFAGPQIVPQTEGFPVPRFNTYFNGNNWRHTTLRYGWGHNYDIRVTPIYVGGNRDLYVLWEGDHLIGPADPDGYMWLNGIRVKLEETETDAEWTLTTPDGTIYTFVSSGQLKSIHDRNNNEVTLTLSDAWDQELIRRVDSVTGSELTLALGYTGDCGNILSSATLGERTITFAYHEEADVYAAAYPVDERLKSIDGDEYTQTFEYADGRRENPPSRVICGEIKERDVGDIPFKYGYSTLQNLLKVAGTAIVNAFQIGSGSDAWQVTTITGPTATYSGITETHVYTANKLQSMAYSRGSSTATYAFNFHPDKGYRLNRSSAAGDIVMDYDPDGNLISVDYPDYETETFTYGVFAQLASKTIGPQVTQYTLDPANGNVTTTTELGGGGVGPRSWSVTQRYPNGTVWKINDPKTNETVYVRNNLGLATSQSRSGVVITRTYDTLGRMLSVTDGEGNITSYTYDDWNRAEKITYPNDQAETQTWRPLGDLDVHFDPAGGLTTKYSYNLSSGKPTKREEDGTLIDYTFTYTSVDNEGDVETMSVNGAGKTYVSTYTYDCRRRVTSEKLGGVKLYSKQFDAFNNILLHEDGEGNTTTYTYYSDNALKKLTRPAGFGFDSYTRDGYGNVVTLENSPGSGTTPALTTVTTYDAFNRAVSVIDSRGKTWTYVYDLLDNRTSITDPNGKTTSYSYDAREYRTNTTLPDGSAVSESRDNNNNRTSMTDPLGNAWGTSYNALQQVTGSTPPAGPSVTMQQNLAGAVTEMGVGTITTTRDLDAWSRATASTVSGLSGSATTTYEPLGALVATDRTAVQTAVERETDGKVKSVTRAGIKTDVSMDGNFDITSKNLPEAYLTRSRDITRDAMGNASQETANCGAIEQNAVNGLGMLETHTSPQVGSVTISHADGGLVKSVEVNGRTTTYDRDGVGNITLMTLPDLRTVTQTFNSRNAIETRSTELGSGSRTETFDRDANLNIKQHKISATGHQIDFTYDAANRMTSMDAYQGIDRSFVYDPNTGQVASDTVGSLTTTYTYDGAGRPSGINVQNGGNYTVTHDDEGRVLTAGGYAYTYNATTKYLETIVDSHGGSPLTLTFTPDAAGYAWERAYPESVSLEQAINDINTVTSSKLNDGTTDFTATFTTPDQVRPSSIARSGGAPGTAIGYNPQKEITSIIHGTNAAGATITREAATGHITSRYLHHVNTTENYSVNGEGWIKHESRGGDAIDYSYRADGARTGYTIGDASAAIDVSAGGAIEKIHNALLGAKLRAPYEGNSIRYVGTGLFDYPTVASAITNMAAVIGTNTWIVPEIIVIRPYVYTNDITLGDAVTNLNPTAASPLIIRGGIDSRTTLTGHIAITNLPYVRLQGFHLTNTNAPSGVLFDGVDGAALAACVVRTSVLFTNCTSTAVIGNTFDGTNAIGGLVLADCSTNALLRNNIYLNDGSNTTAGVEWDAATLVDSDFNCYYPSNSLVPAETNSLYVNPGLTTDGTYRLANGFSAVREAGQPQAAYQADVRGWYRHLTAPSMGAVEYGYEGTDRDSGGRITKRWVAGRLYEYAYDARGQLVSYTDSTNPRRSATYAYDYLGNRIRMTVGGGTDSAVTTRFVYQGQDCVAEYETAPGSSSIARKRIYWLLPELDQRIGFVEIDGSSRDVYYYLTDQSGSVQQIVDEDGNVVNQYDYDAFGNLRLAIEEIPNRYTFQGREWDAHAGHYHYRNRTYIPEWGCFTSPDMNLALGILGEPNGIGNYLFCNNNPLIYTDPLGLEIYEADWGRGVPRGYWPYHASDSWNPLEQVAVTFGNLGSLLVNTVDLGVDKVGAAADRLRVDEIEMFFISNGTPDPGDAFFLGLAGLSRLGAIVRTADRVEDALDLVSDASRTVQRAERIVDPAHDAVRFGARYFDDLALKGTRNAHGSAVVLGKFIEDGRSYTKVAAHYKASYFKLDNWRDLTKAMNQDEIWKINEAFLRQQLKQGKRIILSHDPAKATGFFAREVSYLEALGYRFVKEGWVWKATR